MAGMLTAFAGGVPVWLFPSRGPCGAGVVWWQPFRLSYSGWGARLACSAPDQCVLGHLWTTL